MNNDKTSTEAMKTMTFNVPAMSCGHCEHAVSTEIRKVDGVTDVRVDLATKIVVVTGASLEQAQIFSAVDRAGYEAVG